jgi:SAM-dependent methyltransferase
MLREKTPATVLDIGAGSGFFSRHLLAHTEASEAWCVDISYSEDSDDKEGGKPIHYRRAIDAVAADLVLLMDVLEHVDDDVRLLREYVPKVPEGSHFLITVPAFNFLWSQHDDFLEHRRRYTLTHLEDVVRSAGLNVLHASYYFGGVFPIAATIRKTSRPSGPPRSQMKMHHPIVNAFLKSICYAELPFMRMNRLAGLTVFCFAEKPRASDAVSLH